ncbi:SPRY domain-containing SOCS box protein 4 isoform X2 [Larus michahellis]|uniref:SPRY domain-containing SOCS box protein 4 isoform X2 n=1 Tax=Larus michahellis TaxID=119627 RepID=UPI003D9B49B0
MERFLSGLKRRGKWKLADPVTLCRIYREDFTKRHQEDKLRWGRMFFTEIYKLKIFLENAKPFHIPRYLFPVPVPLLLPWTRGMLFHVDLQHVALDYGRPLPGGRNLHSPEDRDKSTSFCDGELIATNRWESKLKQRYLLTLIILKSGKF